MVIGITCKSNGGFFFFYNIGSINQFAASCPTTCVQVIAVYLDDSS